ncbi:uncharacterized protein MYCFIDRAFT_85494 [Pseudocercospora fijiensis CIRAD86]|uniref:SprT-like domain-containing protein n=1 Tax=Pseudocercospora fijiensis (strain CIRAD86) TaxID=383855 RepID=M2Z1E7_PSEFD|nr:uncharacterized protein MYCFIDRAFT_85494 [Pseudocercospora fijiensis CIRAD86]EME83650.1 hypothetical protein MYCFIDRAFT_85494 [Pseudocercospora fijiensis CIRAD86]
MATLEAHRKPPSKQLLFAKKHSPEAVAKATALALVKRDPISIVKRIFRRQKFRKWMTDWTNAIERDRLRPEDLLPALHIGWRLICTILFFGALQDVPVSFKAHLNRDYNAFGWTSYGNRMFIELDPKAERRREGMGVAETIVYTLIHEGCHAFLVNFSCYCEFCGFEACRDRKPFEIGGGHGIAWQILTMAVEDSAGRCLGVKVDLQRRKDAVNDLRVRDDALYLNFEWVRRKFFA